MDEKLFATVKEATVEVLGVDAAAVTEDAKFGEDLDADSLDLVELVMALEERLDVTIPEEELENITTVGDAVALVSNKVGARA